jgi:hypothetical protein
MIIIRMILILNRISRGDYFTIRETDLKSEFNWAKFRSPLIRHLKTQVSLHISLKHFAFGVVVLDRISSPSSSKSRFYRVDDQTSFNRSGRLAVHASEGMLLSTQDFILGKKLISLIASVGFDPETKWLP